VELRGAAGGVEISRQPACGTGRKTNQALYSGNLLPPMRQSQAMVRFSELGTVRVAERSFVARVRETAREKSAGSIFLKGLLYFFHRDKPKRIRSADAADVRPLFAARSLRWKSPRTGPARLSLLERRSDPEQLAGPH